MITADTVRNLTKFADRKLPVISMYVPVPVQREHRPEVRTRVASMLDTIRPLAENASEKESEDKSLSRAARLSLRADITRIEELVGEQHWKPGTSTAIFACEAAGLFEEISLPRTVRERVVVDGTPWVRPMLAVLDEYYRACVAVLDKKTAQFWESYQDDIAELARVRDRALRKPDYGGWYGLEEHRVAHKADELEKHHYVRLAHAIDQLFRSGEFDLLILGGHQDEVQHFTGFLSKQSRARLGGSFSVDPGTATIGDVKQSAAEILRRYEREQEREQVAEVLEAAAAHRPAAVGLRECLWAADTAAIGLLLIHDHVTAPGVACDNCGWLGTDGATCPVCGSRTRTTPDVIDELVERAIDDGSAVEHVESETPLAEHLLAARLRFPLPPLPDATSASP
jgi:peptide subunit release factor 1 (eRF1)